MTSDMEDIGTQGHLRLMVADASGTLHTVTEHLEQYDLTKPLARASIITDIIATIQLIRRPIA